MSFQPPSPSAEVDEVRGIQGLFLSFCFVVLGVFLRHRGGKKRWKWEEIKGLALT